MMRNGKEKWEEVNKYKNKLMDNFNYKKYLAEGKLLKENMSIEDVYNEAKISIKSMFNIDVPMDVVKSFFDNYHFPYSSWDDELDEPGPIVYDYETEEREDFMEFLKDKFASGDDRPEWWSKNKDEDEGKLFEEDFKNPILDKYLELKKSIDYKTVFPSDLQSFLDSLDNTEREGLESDLAEGIINENEDDSYYIDEIKRDLEELDNKEALTYLSDLIEAIQKLKKEQFDIYYKGIKGIPK